MKKLFPLICLSFIFIFSNAQDCNYFFLEDGKGDGDFKIEVLDENLSLKNQLEGVNFYLKELNDQGFTLFYKNDIEDLLSAVKKTLISYGYKLHDFKRVKALKNQISEQDIIKINTFFLSNTCNENEEIKIMIEK